MHIKVNAIDVTSDGDTYALGQTNRVIIGSLKDGKEEVNMIFISLHHVDIQLTKYCIDRECYKVTLTMSLQFNSSRAIK